MPLATRGSLKTRPCSKKAGLVAFSQSRRSQNCPLLYPKTTVCYLDAKLHPGVKGLIALSIDDGFCGPDNPGADLVDEVREILKTYKAKATFFVTGQHCEQVDRKKIKRLLKDGHELANHNLEDRYYNNDTAAMFAATLKRQMTS